jgi:hypothetical protein
MMNSLHTFIPGLQQQFRCKPFIASQGSFGYLSSRFTAFAGIVWAEASQEKGV